jgi:predicted glutamine amidotransferase
VTQIYGARPSGNGSSSRGSRHDLSFLHLGRSRAEEQPQPERVRETRQEKEARRTERERQARLKERERSMLEENVDGGFLVTLGTYIGPEDYSKPVVRQLQVRLNQRKKQGMMLTTRLYRLNEGWPRSGKGSITTLAHGQNISWWPRLEVCLSLLPMRYHQRWLGRRATTHEAPMSISTT